MSLRIDVANYDCYSQLWLSVLHRAVEDASLSLPEPRMHTHSGECKRGCDRRLYSEDHLAQRAAREWFFADSDDVCSFEWLCSVLNLEPEAVRRELRRRLETIRLEANNPHAGLGSSVQHGTSTRTVLHARTPRNGQHGE